MEFSYAGESKYSDCHDEVCKSLKAAIAQQLPNGEEVEFSRFEGDYSKVKQFWCSYVITFNSSTAMEASGVLDFLQSKPSDFSQHLSNLNFSTVPRYWGCENLLSVEVSKLTEPVKSFVPGTTSI